MAKIMDAFDSELNVFAERMEGKGWAVDFRGENYPPKIVLDQLEPPLFDQAPETPEEEKQACIQVIGRPELQVVTTGKLQIKKKDLAKLTNEAAGLLELFLHGFMQERKEMEAANAN